MGLTALTTILYSNFQKTPEDLVAEICILSTAKLCFTYYSLDYGSASICYWPDSIVYRSSYSIYIFDDVSEKQFIGLNDYPF